jgi:hypothetical protein
MTNPNKDREALRKHIRDNHTSVYLTLVSVIVALALGDLFSQVREIYVTAGFEATSALLWLQIVGAFGAAFGVWVGYCHIFITTRWILGIWDALSVMSLLIALYVINTTVGAANPAWWFFALGVHHIAGGIILFVNMRRARAEPDTVNDALPAPYSLPFFYLIFFGGLSLFFGLLVFMRMVGDSISVLFASVTTIAGIYWSFLWVKAWRKSVGLPQRM